MEFLFVEDVMQMLGLSRSASYKIIKKFNAELEEQGFITVAGRVHRSYFLKRFYYEDEPDRRSALKGSGIVANKKKETKRQNGH